LVFIRYIVRNLLITLWLCLDRVVKRETNFGLPGQWFNAWEPANELELGFIFEDDVEVRSEDVLLFGQCVVRCDLCA
jgi:hypothetical protein